MFIGLDLHKSYSQIAAMTENGEIVAELRLENDRDKLESFASEYAGSEVTIEATGSYRYVYDILDEGMDVKLVNPSKTWVIAEAKVKTDSIDAKMLAHLLRADLGVESYVPTEDIR